MSSARSRRAESTRVSPRDYTISPAGKYPFSAMLAHGIARVPVLLCLTGVESQR